MFTGHKVKTYILLIQDFNVSAHYHEHCRMFTLYAKSLSLDVASHVWDVFFRDGEEMLFRTALGSF